VKRLTCWATRAAAVVVLALVVSPTFVSAQEPPTAAPAPAADDSAKPVAPEATETAQPNPAAKGTDPSGCTGLEEKPCRKNNNCYWIIPKEPDKSGNVKPPYCHKRGHTKKKATDAATPQGTAPPDVPEQTAPTPQPEAPGP
jgi:hypothetical protein